MPRAVSSASCEMSVPMPVAPCNSDNSASRMAPEPALFRFLIRGRIGFGGARLDDEANERIVLEALACLRREFGSTVIVVTHSVRVAEAVDRLIELRDGGAA